VKERFPQAPLIGTAMRAQQASKKKIGAQKKIEAGRIRKRSIRTVWEKKTCGAHKKNGHYLHISSTKKGSSQEREC
jgi:hypothetical protein